MTKPKAVNISTLATERQKVVDLSALAKPYATVGLNIDRPGPAGVHKHGTRCACSSPSKLPALNRDGADCGCSSNKPMLSRAAPAPLIRTKAWHPTSKSPVARTLQRIRPPVARPRRVMPIGGGLHMEGEPGCNYYASSALPCPRAEGFLPAHFDLLTSAWEYAYGEARPIDYWEIDPTTRAPWSGRTDEDKRRNALSYADAQRLGWAAAFQRWINANASIFNTVHDYREWLRDPEGFFGGIGGWAACASSEWVVFMFGSMRDERRIAGRSRLEPWYWASDVTACLPSPARPLPRRIEPAFERFPEWTWPRYDLACYELPLQARAALGRMLSGLGTLSSRASDRTLTDAQIVRARCWVPGLTLSTLGEVVTALLRVSPRFFLVPGGGPEAAQACIAALPVSASDQERVSAEMARSPIGYTIPGVGSFIYADFIENSTTVLTRQTGESRASAQERIFTDALLHEWLHEAMPGTMTHARGPWQIHAWTSALLELLGMPSYGENNAEQSGRACAT